MEGHIDSGVAFIFEGETEQVFYEALFYYFNGKNRNYLLSQKFDEKINEVIYYSQSSFRNIIIRTKTIGTITQIANTAQWFKNSCIKQYENIKWTIFLCYDTDSYKEDITMFYEDDWKNLRRKLRSPYIEVIDLAASSMIEDLFLLDYAGICNYLKIETQLIPKAGNGKQTLKNFFRRNGKIYHEGERSSDFILSLNLETIINKSNLNLQSTGKNLFP